ncbi:MAG: VWA domain-containing protein, partial [Clostridiaceae bacterium]|nr:VWA domain-containing protein [Clostridiaceae bacterium]
MKKSMERALSWVLALAMLVSMGSSALADGTADVIYGTYNDSGVWVQDTTGTGSIDYEDPDVTLSKTAAPTGNTNEYSITLTVETSTTAVGSAAVLVIDTSGSMGICATCNSTEDDDHEYIHSKDCPYYNSNKKHEVTDAQSRMQAARTAAINFIDAYKGTTANTGRYVAVVDFDSDATTVRSWVDVSTTDGYNAAVNAINYYLAAGGGTNLDAGLRLANSLLSSGVASSIPGSRKNVIVLTDGTPTRSRSYGDGTYCNQNILDETASTASTLKTKASVYTVCFGVANDRCWVKGDIIGYTGIFGMMPIYADSDSPYTVGQYLMNSIATASYTDGDGKTHTFAYNADNDTQLYEAFRKIANDIMLGLDGDGLTVTDPMGAGVTATLPADGSVAGDASGFTWDLSNATPTTRIVGTTTYYTYTYTYTVTLDANAEGFDEDAYHPLNARTTLTIPGDTPTVLDFPVPAVKGTAPRYTVTYACGDHGTLAGQDA